jgi:hypothetical protein
MYHSAYFTRGGHTVQSQVLRPAAEANNAIWVVEFYSDRCPFCKSLSPEVVFAAELLSGEDPRVRVAAVDRCEGGIGSPRAVWPRCIHLAFARFVDRLLSFFSLFLSFEALSLCWCILGSCSLYCFLPPSLTTF